MTYFRFPDVSHHKGDLNMQIFADAGYRLVVSKASDNYHLPDKSGKYDFAAERHYDAWFVDNVLKTREAGLVAGAYHFCRWDRPVSSKTEIVKANYRNFQTAIERLPFQHQHFNCAILDMEQSATQLNAAGLNKYEVSAMARDMVELFGEHFEYLILYSGSWWSDVWLTADVTSWMATRMAVYEPEYKSIYNNKPISPNYSPSVPSGFSNEYATSADDFVGKMFAWQFTDKGRFPGIDSNIDLNQTRMPKSELYRIFGQDGSVDPPGTPNDPGCGDTLNKALQKIIDFCESLKA